jgi:hypothetical protein
MELGFTRVATLLNSDVGDLSLDEKGNAVTITTLSEEVAQRIFCRLNFFRGEWFRDLLAGIPYYQLILRKSPPSRVIRAIFNQAILGTEGVRAVLSLNFSVSRERVMTLTFKASLEDGTTFSTSDYAPFQINA